MNIISLLPLYFFFLGLAVGSFLNVLILRYGSRRSVSGRSFCPACLRPLRWFELIPIFSFLIQGGRCRSCRARISIQYPLVEALTALFFLALYIKIFSALTPREFLDFALTAAIFSLFIAIAVYDIRHLIIPDAFVYSLAAVSLARLFILSPLSLSTLSLGSSIFAGVWLALPFFLSWLISGGRWMGLGDAKLALPIGWLLGLSSGVVSVVVSLWVGAAFSVAIIAFQHLFQHLGRRLLKRLSTNFLLFFLGRKITMKSELPFAPFLVIGASGAYFFDLNLEKMIVYVGGLLF